MAVKKKDLPEVSPKNTKDQILSAYNEVVERLQENQIQNPQEEKKKSDEREIISKSSQTSSEGIISHLASLKVTLTKNIDKLSEALLEEFSKLSDLKQAISIEQQHLYDLYQIKETAHTLSALILSHKEESEKFSLKFIEEKAHFEKEMEETKELWNKKRIDLEMEYSELKEKLEKQHKRAEEDYKYSLEVSRRQELQEHAIKQEIIEKELNEKRQEIIQKEILLDARMQEMESLQEKFEKFPDELAKATEKTSHEVTERLETQHKFTITLREKEIEGERSLSLQKIGSLETKIKEQAVLIAQLTQKANESVNQVQEIACKALDASSARPYASYGDKGQDVAQIRQEKLAS